MAILGCALCPLLPSGLASVAGFVTSSNSLKLQFLLIKHRLCRRRAAIGPGLDAFSTGGAEGVAELPVLASEAPHHGAPFAA